MRCSFRVEWAREWKRQIAKEIRSMTSRVCRCRAITWRVSAMRNASLTWNWIVFHWNSHQKHQLQIITMCLALWSQLLQPVQRLYSGSCTQHLGIHPSGATLTTRRHLLVLRIWELRDPISITHKALFTIATLEACNLLEQMLPFPSLFSGLLKAIQAI